MNVLSCFDGCSGAQVALERLGIPVENYYALEVDKWAIQIAQKNFPKTVQLGGIEENCGHYFDNIDLVIGGSPCQGFSNAGEKKNFDDPRSKPFWDFVRLLKEVQFTNSDVFFLLENVNMKQGWQDIISEALGVEPERINSSLVSAQKRDRLYWTNIPFMGQPEDRGISFQSILERDSARKDKAYALTATYHKKGAEATRQRNFKKSKRPIAWIDDQNTRWLTLLECERLQTLPEGYTEGVSNTQRYKMIGNGFTVEVIMHLLQGMLVR